MKCPVCDSQNIWLFMAGIFDSETTSVMECGHCGLQFLNPLMSEQEEADYYEGYYRKQQARHFKAMDLADLQQRAYEHYGQYRSVYLELIAGCKSILEIGSGSGGFLKFVGDFSPETRLVSIERCSENVEFIKQRFGEKVSMADSIDEVLGEKFDCVAAFGVIEHVRDSRGFLAKLTNYLSDEGKMALFTQNKANLLVYGYNLEEYKKFAYMKQHYFTFTEESFNILAEQTGLRVRKFNYMQFWSLDNHLSWLRYKKPRDFSDFTSLLSRQTLDAYNENLIKNKATDVMMAVLSKRDGCGIYFNAEK